MRVLMLSLTLLAAGAAQAAVYKCTDAAGGKHYQDRPCEDARQATPFDAQAGYVTTIDSQASRREAQGALLTREQIRARHIEVVARPVRQTEAIFSQPVPDEAGYLDGGYPVYPYIERGYDHRRHRRHPHREHPRVPQRPDETPMIDPPRGQGSNYVPQPPTIRQVAPRSPATARGSGR